MYYTTVCVEVPPKRRGSRAHFLYKKHKHIFNSFITLLFVWKFPRNVGVLVRTFYKKYEYIFNSRSIILFMCEVPPKCRGSSAHFVSSP